MKIGVAMSGCDIGGLSAAAVLRRLEAHGFEIGMISACCVPAITSLLYARGFDETSAQKLTNTFLDDVRESDIDFAVANLSVCLHEADGRKIPIAINSVNVSDGTIVTFTDDRELKTTRIRTFGIDDTYDALSATISLMDGLGSYRYKSMRLCDFCCWYGCPVHQLKLSGYDKIISIGFVPRLPKTPYEVLVKQMITSSSSSAVAHISIEFAESLKTLSQYEKIATDRIDSCASSLLIKTLF